MSEQASVQVLFVCTGNTCRSPMAESIARHLLRQMPANQQGRVRVLSAGVGADDGGNMTPQATAALRELGIEPHRHWSKGLTRVMIDESDVIYAMSASHAAAITEIDPDAAAKVRLIDPSGRDVPDPMGAGPSIYSETARRLLTLVERRFKEILA